MGLAAVAVNAVLWILSLPWVAWKLISWQLAKVRASAIPKYRYSALYASLHFVCCVSPKLLFFRTLHRRRHARPTMLIA